MSSQRIYGKAIFSVTGNEQLTIRHDALEALLGQYIQLA